MMGREGIMDTLLLILIILLVVFGFGGFYVGRPGYSGAGAGAGNILYILGDFVFIVLLMRLLGISR